MSAAADLPEYFPSELELRLQDRATFDQMHEMGEKGHILFIVGHKAIHVAAEPSVDNDLLTGAIITGVETFEIVTGFTSSGRYDSDSEQAAVLECANSFVGDIKKPDDFMAKADYALERLVHDAPRLTEVLEEVTARHVNRDKVATQFALRGAAVLRGMHIYVDRRIAS